MNETINLMKKTKAEMVHIIFCQIQEKNKLDEKVKEYASQIYEKQKEFEKLKEENEKQKLDLAAADACQSGDIAFQYLHSHLCNLKEENNKLKEENTNLKEQNIKDTCRITKLSKGNKKFMKQIDSWERWGGEITNELIVMEEWEHYVNKGLLKDSKGAGIEINLT